MLSLTTGLANLLMNSIGSMEHFVNAGRAQPVILIIFMTGLIFISLRETPCIQLLMVRLLVLELLVLMESTPGCGLAGIAMFMLTQILP